MRPSGRIEPGPGQESVWDYPRPPAVRPLDAHVVVHGPGGVLVADTRRAVEVLETFHPPGVYIPRADLTPRLVVPSRTGSTFCEFKGFATYWDLAAGGRLLQGVGWSYETPTHGYEAIAGHVTFYPDRVGRCTVDGEEVVGQEGGFYGGWISSRVTGPFKGPPGTRGW